MATLKEYFLKDFATTLSMDFAWQSRDVPPTEIPVKVAQEMHSGARFVAYYIPKHPQWLAICMSLAENLAEAIKKSDDVITITGFAADRQLGLVGSNQLCCRKQILCLHGRRP